MEPIQIVTTADNGFVIPLAVMLNSMLENNHSARLINVYTIDGGISYKNKIKLGKAVARFDVKLHFLEISPDIQELKGWENERTMFYRLFIPDLLDTNISKALYLDSDLIIREDITRLWDISLGHHFLAAVKDAGLGYSRHHDLGIPLHFNYFNSGVMLMNLTEWRKHDIPNKVVDFINKHPSDIHFYDQDGLNAVLYDKWLEVEAKWNYTTGMSSLFQLDPAIIHYTGYNKPWLQDHPLQDEFFKYWERTPWE